MKRRTLRDPLSFPKDDRERRRRMRLLKRARAGDAGALCILREKYHLRLPLIERQIPYTLPWMRRREVGPGRERSGR